MVSDDDYSLKKRRFLNISLMALEWEIELNRQTVFPLYFCLLTPFKTNCYPTSLSSETNEESSKDS